MKPRRFSLTLPSSPIAIASLLCACSSSQGSSAGICPAVDAGSTAVTLDAGPASGFDDAGVPITTGAIPLSRCSAPVFTDYGAHGPIYRVGVEVGGSQTFQAMLDTGSSALGVPSSSCTDCSGVSPLYTPGPTATDTHRSQSLAYSGGQITGELVQDTAQIGASPAVTVTLVSVQEQEGLFTANPICQDADGIFGLAPPAAGEVDYLPELVASKGMPDVFSVGLCDTGGALWLGGVDPSAATGAPQFTPMGTDFGFDVHLTGVAVGGTSVNLPAAWSANMTIDTGEPQLLLPSDAFAAATAAIAASSQFQKLFGDAGWFQNATSCVASCMSASDLDAALPSLTLTFGSAPAISVTAKATASYLQAQVSGGQTSWCPGLGESAEVSSNGDGTSGPPVGLIGDAFMRSSLMIFDVKNGRLGFAPHTCP